MFKYLIFFVLMISINALGGGRKKAPPPAKRKTLSTADKKKCARLYEHSNYKGKEWVFCPGKSKPSGWNDKASSIRIPQGGKVKVCKHSNEGGPCFSYFSDVPWVGDHLNDSISWVKLP